MRGAIGHVDLDRLNLEGDGTVLGEHGCYHIDHNVTGYQLDPTEEGEEIAYSLVLSVAVVSMKMFVVFPGTILESIHQPRPKVNGMLAYVGS